MNNTNEKSLVIVKKKNVLTKIVDFFLNIFNKNKHTYKEIEQDNYIPESNNTIIKNNFVAINDIEKKFQDFRRGYIKEEDLTEEEKEKLTKMFQERIKKEQEETEYFRKKILEIREKYLKDV